MKANVYKCWRWLECLLDLHLFITFLLSFDSALSFTEIADIKKRQQDPSQKLLFATGFEHYKYRKRKI